MSPELHLDASDYRRLEVLFGRMPADIQRIAFSRAVARTRRVVERTYARFAARHIKVLQKLVMAAVSSRMSKGEINLKIKSTNIPLHKLGVRGAIFGVYVRGRGRYEGKFFIVPKGASRVAGHVLRRDDNAGRLPARMMFGPSPADAVLNNRQIYEDLLGDIAEGEFRSVIVQQVIYLLGRV